MWQHTFLMVTFIVLVVSGFALRFNEGWLSQLFFGWVGGFELRGVVHRVAAVLFLLTVVWHGVYLISSSDGMAWGTPSYVASGWDECDIIQGYDGYLFRAETTIQDEWLHMPLRGETEYRVVVFDGQVGHGRGFGIGLEQGPHPLNHLFGQLAQLLLIGHGLVVQGSSGMHSNSPLPMLTQISSFSQGIASQGSSSLADAVVHL